MKKKIVSIICVGISVFMTACSSDSENSFIEKAVEAGMEYAKQTQEEARKEKIEEQFTQEELVAAQDASSSLFYYEALTEEEKTIYNEIYLSLISREQAIVSTLDQNQLDKVYQCVMNDHPEIFYSSGYVCTSRTINGKDVELNFSAKYEMEDVTVKTKQRQIDDYVKQCFAGMPSTDAYGQIKYIYDYVIEHTEYNLQADNNQNICSVFIDGESVCQGYSEAVQYLLNELGYSATIVTGQANYSGHAWNLVQLEGNYYYLDATWGDVDYQEQEVTAADGAQMQQTLVNYDYFLVTTEQLTKTHTIETVVAMPACTSILHNYYVREGRYFEFFEETKIAEIFNEAKTEGDSTVTLKAANAVVFEELRSYLLDEQKIFDYLSGETQISYYVDDRMNTICFWLER